MSERLRNARAPIWLLEVGADTEAKDNRGKTALYYARKNRHTSVVKLLPASSGCCVVM